MNDYVQTLPSNCTQCGNSLKKSGTHQFVEGSTGRIWGQFCLDCVRRDNIKGQYYENGMCKPELPVEETKKSKGCDADDCHTCMFNYFCTLKDKS